MQDVQKVDGKYGKQGVRDEFVAFIFDTGASTGELLQCPTRFPRFVEVTTDRRNPVCAINDAMVYLTSFGLRYHFRTFGYEPVFGWLPPSPGVQTVDVPKGARYTWIMEWLTKNSSAREFAWVGADGCDTSLCPDKYIASWFHEKRIRTNPNVQVARPPLIRPGLPALEQKPSEYQLDGKANKLSDFLLAEWKP